MDTVVESRRGKLRGRLSDGVTAFQGVPYAAPPFGENRLRPPRPVEPWDGVRDALTFGPKSPQVAYPPGIAEALAELVGTGEDCLTLNIWTPDLGAVGRPVMVWIPGGMFEFHATGATAFYDGSRMRESRTSGSARGARSNPRPYRVQVNMRRSADPASDAQMPRPAPPPAMRPGDAWRCTALR
jgi:carboxylesterase type B